MKIATSKNNITFKFTIILIVLTGIYFYGQYFLAGFNFAFHLDDPYIHLSVAKNFALNGNWGPISGEFNSSSSSPLFTLAVSLFYFLGIGGFYVPILINIISGIIILLMIKNIAEEQNISNSILILILTAILIIMPLYYIIFVSMEHVLHFAFILYLVYKASKIFSSGSYNFTDILMLSVVSGLTTMIRYENLFFVAIVGVIFLFKKKFKVAMIFGFISILPALIYGIISVVNGEYILPNSVLVKGVKRTGGIIDYLKYAVRSIKFLVYHPETGILFLTTALYTFKKFREKQFDLSFYFTFISAALLYIHPSFALIGWYGRYEAYLTGLACVSFFWIVPYLREQKNLKYIPHILFAALIFYKGLYMPYSYRYGMKNIYEQQVQMGKFVNEYYNDAPIAVNDIGAVAYYSDAKILDLWALASTELTGRIVNKMTIDGEYIDSLARAKNTEIVISYGKNLVWYFPNDWEKVASWKIQDLQTPSQDIIYFYALEQDKNILRKQIEEYSSTKLPKEVEVKYY